LHLTAENGNHADGAVDTFKACRALYEITAFPDPVDGADAVNTFVSDMFRAFPDWQAEPMGPLVHCDSGIFVEVRMTGTQQGEWLGIPPQGGRMDVQVACMYDFDGTDLIAERVWFDMATVSGQLTGTI
jgi:predicted ester cyclase